MEDSYVLQLKNRKFSDLYLCFCGYARCEPLHSFGPAVRPNYVLHYIVDGQGKFRTEDEEYSLQAGQGFLIEPGVQTFYQADCENPWTYLWIGFEGARAGDYMRDLGFGGSHPVYQCSCGERLRQIVLKMLKNNTYTVANEYLLEGLLYTFLSELAADLNIAPASGESGRNLYVQKAVEFIHNNYSNAAGVSDIAAFVGIDRSYLYTLFRQTVQMSPSEYLTNYRLTRAAELLMITDLSVESVARSCGYQDAMVFSKNFKKKTGLSPSAYRKENLAKQQEALRGKIGNLEQI